MFNEAIKTLNSRIDVYQNRINMRYLTLEGIKNCSQKIKELEQAIAILEREGKNGY
ncbi:hypothetical protein LLG07_00080 [bacterium]|nr:hypothetical protein [bacterium]